MTSFNENREFFNLYPNPNDGHFTINFTTPLEAENYTVTVFNLIGKILSTGKSCQKKKTPDSLTFRI